MLSLVKTIIRQVTPPLIYNPAKAIFLKARDLIAPPKERPPSPLKVRFDELNKGAAEDEIVMRPGLKLKLHPDSRIPFEYFCHIEEEVASEMDHFLEETRGKVRLLDIGALHGVFSLVFAAGGRDRRAVAVDASPVAYSRLLYNIYKNDFKNVIPVECALSSEPGFLSMHYEWEHAVAAKSDRPNRKTLTVRKMTGDELCGQLGFHPDVIKIDVEGHEVKVIKGLSREILEQRPLIFLEIHPSRIADENDSVAEMLNVFRSANYEACAVITGTPIGWEAIAATREPVLRLYLKPLP